MIFLLSIMILFAWVLNPFCNITTKTIHKGFHRPFLQIPLCLPRFRSNKHIYFSKNVMLTESCKTEHNHINKIFGFTVGGLFENSIHENSFRFGWQIKDNELWLVAYYYINGVRNHKYIKKVKFGNVYQLVLYRSDKDVLFSVHPLNKIEHTTQVHVPFVNNQDNGYIAGLYYGGESKAPKTMDIKLW